MNASAPRRRRRRVLALGPIPEITDDGGVKLEPADSLFDVLGLCLVEGGHGTLYTE